jgi:hypothetical protein
MVEFMKAIGYFCNKIQLARRDGLVSFNLRIRKITQGFLAPAGFHYM